MASLMISHNIYAATQVSQHGITWTFSTNAQVGQFINGDWYVIGPVTVTSVSPSPTSSKHGSVVNPQAVYPAVQGYDSQVRAFDASVRVNYPLNLNPGDSLVSSVSWDVNQSRTDLIGLNVTASNHNLKTVAVLTCLGQTPPVDAFRPPYAGTNKPLYRKSQIQYDKLPRVTPPQKQTNPNYNYDDVQAGLKGRDFNKTVATQFARYFERPWILHVDDWQGRSSHPTENMPNYHVNVYEIISEAAVLLTTDLPDIDNLLIPYIQLGIDSHYITLSGTSSADSSIHKWPILFAGIMLNDSAMKSNSYTFRTDWMTYFVQDRESTNSSGIVPSTQGWTGSPALFRQDPGNMEHEHLHPSEWDIVPNGGGIKREKYRRLNTPTWPGVALAAKLTSGGQEAWDHPAFFAYVDRWMTEPDASNKTYLENTFNGGASIGSGGGWTRSSFITAMYEAYSGVTPPPPPGEDTVAPNAPTNLTSSSQTSTSIQLNWSAPSAASDGDTAVSYAVHRNGTFLTQVVSTNYTNSGLTQNTSYSFEIYSIDDAGNSSTSAATGTYSTEAGGGDPPPPPPSGFTSNSSSWMNQSIASQTDTFQFEFDATPLGSNIDGVTGLSDIIPDSYSDLGVTVRFNINGMIDARHGSIYTAQSSVPYQSGTTYHFRLVINIPNHTYDIYVTPAGSSEQTIGTGYAFRNGQETTSILSQIGLAPGGPHTVANIVASPIGGPVDTNDPPVINSISSQSATETVAISFNVSATDPDGDSLTYSASGLPTGASFSGQTFNWVPQIGQAGNYTVNVTASDGQLQDTESVTINVAPKPTSGPTVVSLTLYNADTNSPISGFNPMPTNAEINLTELPTQNLNIVASTSPAIVGSVRFSYDGNNTYHIENAAPYALAGDVQGNFSPWTPSLGQHTLTVTGYSASNTGGDAGNPYTISFNVTNTTSGTNNRAPELSPIGDRSIGENQSLVVGINGSDPDGDSMNYWTSTLPPGAAFANQAFTWMPTYDQAGVHSITFYVSDGSLLDSETIDITVTNINRPPIWNSLPNQQVAEAQLLTFSVSATDPDGDTINYSVENLPAGATFVNQTFSWTPGNNASATNLVTFIADDGEDEDYLPINITVAQSNQPPVLEPIGNKVVNENEAVGITLIATDGDNDDLSYHIGELPEGAVFEGNVFTWIPNYDQAGEYEIGFGVFDGQVFDTEQITLTVNNTNRSPVMSEIDNISSLEQDAISITVNVVDDDGDELSYSAEGLNFLPGALFENNEFTWTPDYDAAGVYQVTFSVTDGSLSDSQAVTLTIANLNRPPVFEDVSNQQIGVDQPFTLSLSATDPDDDPIVYTAEGLPSGAQLIGNQFSWTPQAGDVGNHPIQFIAGDGVDEEKMLVTISVENGNIAPVFEPISSPVINENETINFSVMAIDADVVTYSVQNLPAGASFVDQIFSWSPDYDAAGTYSVTFVASDGEFDTLFPVTITVNNTNRAPEFTPVNNQFVDQFSTLTLPLTAIDPDGDPVELTMETIPSGASFNSGLFTWTPGEDQNGQTKLTVKASDGELESQTTFDVYVLAVNLDTIAPAVSHVSPENGDIQVPLNSLVVVDIADSGNGVDSDSVIIRLDGQTIYQGGAETYTSELGKTRRAGSSVLYKYTFQPSIVFDNDQTLTLTVEAKDQSNNAMETFESSFVSEMQTFGNISAVHAIDDASLQSQPETAHDGQGSQWFVWATGDEGSRNISVTRSVDGAIQNVVGVANNANDQLNPDIAIDASGRVIVCWQENISGRWAVFTSSSTDGLSWSTPKIIRESENDQVNPVIASNSILNSNFAVAYQEKNSGVEQIHVIRTTDGFTTMTHDVVTSNPQQHVDPTIAFTNNVIYLAWTDLRHSTAAIYGANSSDGWVNRALVNLPSNQSEPDLVVTTNTNTMYLVWTDDRFGHQDVFYGVSSNGFSDVPLQGVNVVDDTTQRDQHSAKITCYEDGNNTDVFTCWQDSRNSGIESDLDIYFAKLSSQSKTNVLVTAEAKNANQTAPAIGIDKMGDPYLIWVDARNSDQDIYYAGATNIFGVQVAQQEIETSQGGIVGTAFEDINDAQDVGVQVPAGAFWEDVTLTVSQITNPTSDGTLKDVIQAYEFGPSSELEFAQPVTITIPYEVASASNNVSNDVFWYDPLSGELSQTGISNVEDIKLSPTLRVIRFTTTHFSQYLVGQVDQENTQNNGGRKDRNKWQYHESFRTVSSRSQK